MFIAVAFAFPSGTQRFWTGFGDLSFGGDAYIGTGTLGSITVKPENVRLLAERKTYQLSGVDPLLASEADIDASFGRSVTEYLGFLSAAGTVVATPEIYWEGRMDNIRRVYGENPVIEVNAEHRLVMMDRPDGWRFTHEHQLMFYAADLGFRETSSVETSNVLWGGYGVLPGSAGRQSPRFDNLP
jgi:hypothetical protein